MISSVYVYNGVSLILGIASLIAIFLVPRFIPDNRSRIFIIVACVLIILMSAMMPFLLKIYKFHSIAYTGEAVGKAQGAMEKISRFRDMALLGSVFEIVAVGLLAGAAKRLIALKSGAQTGKEAAQ